MSSARHLSRRWWWSLFPRRVSPGEAIEVSRILNGGELRLWNRMQTMDRRHSLMVLERRRMLSPVPVRDDEAAALLHDIGKTASRLGVWGRVAATIIGARGWRSRLYHRHEQIGIEMLRSVGSDGVVALLRGHAGDRSEALVRADEL